MKREAADALIKDISADPTLQSMPAQFVPPPLPPTCRSARDAIRHTCAPPIVESAKAQFDAIASPMTGESYDSIETKRNRRDAVDKKDRAVWLSSLTLHSVLIVILGLLLSPADFGDKGLQRLTVSFSNQNELRQEVEFKFAAVEDVSVSQDLPETDQPFDSPVDAAIDFSVGSESGQDGGDTDPGEAGEAGPNGSFFGIEAEGHEFVYVLDMSGSMEGRRYEGATAELVRSVCELHETQNFYVLLFDDRAVQMFGEQRFHPQPIPATVENKARLSAWLAKAFHGGGTDPREALHVALQMNPSAIFMLSDGEFNGKKKQKRSKLLGGNSDAFSIVAAAANQVPIHAIAFEDKRSCANMELLAEMTNGEYRFTELKDNAAAKKSLALARRALAHGNKSKAEQLLGATIANFGKTEAGRRARRILTAILIESAEQAIKEDSLLVANDAIIRFLRIDAQGIVSADAQQRLVTTLMRRSQLESADNVGTTATSILAEVVNQFPNSWAAQQIIGPQSRQLLDEARTLSANNQPVLALSKMEKLVNEYPRTVAAKECRMEQRQMMDDVIARARQLRQSGAHAASAQYLRRLIATIEDATLVAIATRELEDLGSELLVKVRDARIQRDRRAKDDANRELTEGFADDAILEKVRRDFSLNERRARDLLRRGIKLEKDGHNAGAIKRYNAIFENYPDTLAATKAQSRVRDLKRQPIATKDQAMSREAVRYENKSGF